MWAFYFYYFNLFQDLSDRRSRTVLVYSPSCAKINHTKDLPLILISALSYFKAICTGQPGCANGGTCISPERCRCMPGWKGAKCRTGMYDISYWWLVHCMKALHRDQPVEDLCNYFFTILTNWFMNGAKAAQLCRKGRGGKHYCSQKLNHAVELYLMQYKGKTPYSRF